MFQFLKAFKTRVFVSVVFVLIVGNTVSAQTVTLQATDDAMVYRGNATNNYGSDGKLQVKKSDNATLTRKYIEGKKVQEEFASSSSNININISTLVRGIYTLEVNQSCTNEIIGNARFLKQ
jgi:hypothetical protein